ncbi:MAG: PAS domain-containing protein [Proteobacteria bacterium]|nr:PAS domain-containing protein [Pseudomonadota bacterium]MBI3499328.1 PAS domain-containing protein [Pseudomonadota bacterium]
MTSVFEKLQGWVVQKVIDEAQSADQDLVHHYGSALALDQIAPNELRQLYEHWATLKGQRLLPTRADVDISQLGFCIGHLAVAEIEDDPFRVRYEFVGDGLIQLYGEDLTGRYVDELYSAPVRAEALSAYRRVVGTAEPMFTRRVFDLLIKRFGYYRLMLPLASSGRGVDHVLVGIYPTDGRVKRAVEWRSVAEILNFWRSTGFGSR